jgi:hypothetical protein
MIVRLTFARFLFKLRLVPVKPDSLQFMRIIANFLVIALLLAAGAPAVAQTATPEPTATKPAAITTSEPALDQEHVVHLLNGADLNSFYSYFKEYGVQKDPDQVFTITNGMLRISGRHLGYLATRTNFSDYKLMAEFKWGRLAWGKRIAKTRNSGILVHATGVDKLWMRSFECQIQEGATGDVVLQSGAQLKVGDETKFVAWATFERPGKQPWHDELGFRGPNEVENPYGEWNTMEMLCDSDLLKVTVNGKVTVDGRGANPQSGQILLQSNEAEIFFRRLDLYPIKRKPVAARSTSE